MKVGMAYLWGLLRSYVPAELLKIPTLEPCLFVFDQRAALVLHFSLEHSSLQYYSI